MAPDTVKTDAEREQRIREIAYQLWQADGAPEGKSDHYWQRARELLERSSKNACGSAREGAYHGYHRPVLATNRRAFRSQGHYGNVDGARRRLHGAMTVRPERLLPCASSNWQNLANAVPLVSVTECCMRLVLETASASMRASQELEPRHSDESQLDFTACDQACCPEFSLFAPKPDLSRQVSIASPKSLGLVRR